MVPNYKTLIANGSFIMQYVVSGAKLQNEICKRFAKNKL